MKTIFRLLLAGFLSLESIACAQQAAVPGATPTPAPPSDVPNPFDEIYDDGGMMMDMGGYGGMGGDSMAAGAGMDMGMGMESGMGMGGGMGMGMTMAPSPEDVFRFRLKNAIKRIGAATSEQDKATLMRYTEKGLTDHYDQMISRRKQDLERLKQSLAQLETDLSRREAAKERVVKLQLQSAILASEGLLDLNSLQSGAADNSGTGMMGSTSGEMGSGMGFGN